MTRNATIAVRVGVIGWLGDSEAGTDDFSEGVIQETSILEGVLLLLGVGMILGQGIEGDRPINTTISLLFH